MYMYVHIACPYCSFFKLVYSVSVFLLHTHTSFVTLVYQVFNFVLLSTAKAWVWDSLYGVYQCGRRPEDSTAGKPLSFCFANALTGTMYMWLKKLGWEVLYMYVLLTLVYMYVISYSTLGSGGLILLNQAIDPQKCVSRISFFIYNMCSNVQQQTACIVFLVGVHLALTN